MKTATECERKRRRRRSQNCFSSNVLVFTECSERGTDGEPTSGTARANVLLVDCWPCLPSRWSVLIRVGLLLIESPKETVRQTETDSHCCDVLTSSAEASQLGSYPFLTLTRSTCEQRERGKFLLSFKY